MRYPPSFMLVTRITRPTILTMALLLLLLLLAVPAGAGGEPESVKQLTVFETIDQMEASGEIAWDWALLYRCQAYKQRDKLPPELASLPYPEQFVCPFELFVRAKKELGNCSPEVRALLGGTFDRPESIGFVQSSIAPIRVHYNAAKYIPRAEEFLGHVEQFYRYFVDVGGFYHTPPDDNRGGSNDYDVYIVTNG